MEIHGTRTEWVFIAKPCWDAGLRNQLSTMFFIATIEPIWPMDCEVPAMELRAASRHFESKNEIHERKHKALRCFFDGFY